MKNITIPMEDAHRFAQALIADGWLNDDPNCVDTLHRRLVAFVGICGALAAMKKETDLCCPECCAMPGQPHASTCSALKASIEPAIDAWRPGLPLPGADESPRTSELVASPAFRELPAGPLAEIQSALIVSRANIKRSLQEASRKKDDSSVVSYWTGRLAVINEALLAAGVNPQPQ